MKDYYYILGVSSDASYQEIRLAFRKLSNRLHPDKNNGDQFFQNKFKDVNEAYAVLSNSQSRREFDLEFNSSQLQKKYADKIRKFEKELKLKYEEKLKKKEEEIRTRYQNGSKQRHQESFTENRRAQVLRARIEKEKKRKITQELGRLRSKLQDKETELERIIEAKSGLQAEISRLTDSVKNLEDSMNSFSETPKGNFHQHDNDDFQQRKHQAIVKALDQIRDHVPDTERIFCLHLLLSYARDQTFDETLAKVYPHLLSLIVEGTIDYQPFLSLYRQSGQNGSTVRQYEEQFSNYVLQ